MIKVLLKKFLIFLKRIDVTFFDFFWWIVGVNFLVAENLW